MELKMERGGEIDPAVMEGALRAMFGLEGFVARSGFAKPLLDLVKLRASRVNGCAYCFDMHTRDARARGESEQRLSLLDAWRESSHDSERERAALIWTEELPPSPMATSRTLSTATYARRSRTTSWPA